MVRRELFLEKKSLREAKRIWNKFLTGLNFPRSLGKEEIPVEEATGRISAETVFSKQSSPFYTASAVDGIAVNASSTVGASVSSPLVLKLGKDGIFVNTGDPIPQGYDAVIMIENAEVLGSKFRILSPIQPYRNVRLIGENIGIKETLLFPNEEITPARIGVLLAGGITRVSVYKKPSVLIIPTGEEIKKPGEMIKIGDIVDTNSYMFKAFVKQFGGEAEIAKIHSNNAEKISHTIRKNKNKFDMFVIVGGSAKGSKDFTAKVFREHGEILVHGISMQPGKPALLGSVFGKPAIGMPGFPVSSFIVAYIFLESAVFAMQGKKVPEPDFIKAAIKRPIPSSIGTTEFLRVKVGKVGKEIVAVPLKKGAGVLSSVSRADGILEIGFDKEGIGAGENVKIELLADKKTAKNSLLFIGSNDPLLNFLFSFVKERNPEFNFGIVNSGSLAGLLAFERGECSVTAAHLFDEKTETYNEPFLKKYVSKDYFTVHLSEREQGLIVARGNPKNIRGIKDLKRKDIKFVNRQKGSGTRVITDYLLKSAGISQDEVNGYYHEEYTHLAVANNVKLGGADCGVGIRYVADAIELDFIPLKKEQYDLVFLKDELHRKEVKLLLDALTGREFAKLAKKFKGYKFIGRVSNAKT